MPPHSSNLHSDESELQLTRAALIWLLHQSIERNDEKLAGGLIGGKLTSIMSPEIKDKYPTFKSNFNRLVSVLKKNDLLKCDTNDASFEHNGFKYNYKRSPLYAAAPSTKNAVLAVYNGAKQDWASPRPSSWPTPTLNPPQSRRSPTLSGPRRTRRRGFQNHNRAAH